MDTSRSGTTSQYIMYISNVNIRGPSFSYLGVSPDQLRTGKILLSGHFLFVGTQWHHKRGLSFSFLECLLKLCSHNIANRNNEASRTNTQSQRGKQTNNLSGAIG
jgi:hypothetical protein